MAQYVDGFVLPVPRRKLADYKRMATRASKVWKEYGALEYRECVGDDLKVKGVVSFPRLARAKAGDTVVFAWIVYRSRAHRDRVNARVMKDPRILAMSKEPMPIDPGKMAYGGFEVIVAASSRARAGRPRRK